MRDVAAAALAAACLAARIIAPATDRAALEAALSEHHDLIAWIGTVSPTVCQEIVKLSETRLAALAEA